MKVNEVPQYGKTVYKAQLVLYAVDDEGKFVPTPSSGWETAFCSGHNLELEFKEFAEQAKVRIKNNQSSPLEYFMFRATLDLDGLAQFMEISKRKVKKHLTVKGFEKIDDAMLEQYAHLLHTDVETIKKFKSTL
jgi:hypothetical protein